MIIMLIVIIGLVIIGVAEGLLIRVILRELRVQTLEVELLISIIEESHLGDRQAEK